MGRYVIASKVYDTKKSDLVHDFESELLQNDLRWYRQSLYRTCKGAFFVVGEGGPMTQWAEDHGNTVSSGGGVRALDDSEALEWLQLHGADAETLEQHFALEEA